MIRTITQGLNGVNIFSLSLTVSLLSFIIQLTPGYLSYEPGFFGNLGEVEETVILRLEIVKIYHLRPYFFATLRIMMMEKGYS